MALYKQYKSNKKWITRGLWPKWNNSDKLITKLSMTGRKCGKGKILVTDYANKQTTTLEEGNLTLL